VPKFEAVATSVNKVSQAMSTVAEATKPFGGAAVTFGEEAPGSAAWVANGQRRLSEFLRPPSTANFGMGGGQAAATVNINGILMGNDPSARDQLMVLVNDAVRESLRGQGARVGA
jgi:hypothetical protein